MFQTICHQSPVVLFLDISIQGGCGSVNISLRLYQAAFLFRPSSYSVNPPSLRGEAQGLRQDLIRSPIGIFNGSNNLFQLPLPLHLPCFHSVFYFLPLPLTSFPFASAPFTQFPMYPALFRFNLSSPLVSSCSPAFSRASSPPLPCLSGLKPFPSPVHLWCSPGLLFPL